AAQVAGIIQGHGNGTFAPDDNMTIEQLAIVAVKMLDLTFDDPETEAESVDGNVSEWAHNYVAAAIRQGIFPGHLPDYTQNATREMLVNVSYEVTASDLLNPTEEENGENDEA